VKCLLAKYQKRPLGTLSKIQKMEIIKEITRLVILLKQEFDTIPNTPSHPCTTTSQSITF